MKLKVIFTFLLLQLSFVCLAQQNEMGNSEKLAHALFNEICKEIEIDDNTKEKLRPLYIEFVKETRPEQDKHEPPHGGGQQNPRNNSQQNPHVGQQQNPRVGQQQNPRDTQQNLSEEEIEVQIKEQLAHGAKLAKLREEYYVKFRTILKPSQIKKMYDVERSVTLRIRNELGERDNKRGPDGGMMKGRRQ